MTPRDVYLGKCQQIVYLCQQDLLTREQAQRALAILRAKYQEQEEGAA